VSGVIKRLALTLTLILTTDARLHTATSWGLVYWTISVQRLDDLRRRKGGGMRGRKK